MIRRVTGRSLQAIFEQRVRAPYGLELYLGFPEALEGRYRKIQSGLADLQELAAF